MNNNYYSWCRNWWTYNCWKFNCLF